MERYKQYYDDIDLDPSGEWVRHEDAMAEMERLCDKIEELEEELGDLDVELYRARHERDALKAALDQSRTNFCRISLSSINSMSTKTEGGRIAREAIKGIDAALNPGGENG